MPTGMHSGLSDKVLEVQSVASQSLTGAVNGTVHDMQGWNGIRFVINVGAITGLGTLDGRVMRDTAVGMGTAVNVPNAAITQVVAAGNNNLVIIDVYRPASRFVRLTLTQATNTVMGGATATLYGRAGILPPIQSATQVVKVVDS